MNCEEMKNNLLLAQSGELPDAQCCELKSHIEECEDCRKYSHMLDMISSNIEPYKGEDPSPATMSKIYDAISTASEQKTVIAFPGFARALAYAALVTMLIGGSLLLPNKDNQISQIDTLKDIMAIVCDDDAYILDGNPSDDPDSEIGMLAEQLLRYQEGSDAYFIDEEYLPEELDPTALQFHNTHELPQKKCV
jgi:hypothetical protein